MTHTLSAEKTGFTALIHLTPFFVGTMWAVLFSTLVESTGLLSFLATLTIIIAPVAMWLIGKKRNGDFIDDQGREAVRFQLVMIGYTFLLIIILVMFGFGDGVRMMVDESFAPNFNIYIGAGGLAGVLGAFLTAFFVFWTVMEFVAAHKAYNGKRFRYPFVFSPRKRAEKKAQV